MNNYSIFSGSYNKNDVEFLLKILDIKNVKINEANLHKEYLIQQKNIHYSEMITPEKLPSKEYLQLFYKALDLNKLKMAKHCFILAEKIFTYAKQQSQKNIVLISLVRAGTPIGVILKHILESYFLDKNITKIKHYSISILRDKGIDVNALNHIIFTKKYNAESIFFIDGWTGKGVISNELKKSIFAYNQQYKTNVSDKLFVLTDISNSAFCAASNEDYLIPSSILNSTISGLISRSILNKEINIKNGDFHGCLFYNSAEFLQNDLSKFFIQEILTTIKNNINNINNRNNINNLTNFHENSPKFFDKTNTFNNTFNNAFDIQKLMAEYKVKNVNLIKPGIGESTRVLLRRFPEKIVLKNADLPELQHLILLAQQKQINIEYNANLPNPLKAIAIIKNTLDN